MQMKYKTKTKGKYGIYSFLSLILITVMIFGVADFLLPDQISVIQSSDEEITQAHSLAKGQNAFITDYTMTAKLFGLIPFKEVNVDVLPDIKLIPGGGVFGVKFFTKGIIVIGMSDIETDSGILAPASKAGLQVRDIITEVDGVVINTVEEMAEIVERGAGKSINVTFIRNGESRQTELTPVMSVSDKKYKTGLWVRDSTAGIGTITYYNPENSSFAGLGHGICDVDTGELMPLLRGTVVDIELTDVIRGKEGNPGELKGKFGVVKRGALIGNTSQGVYGFLDNSPVCGESNALPIALKTDVTEGEAFIYANLDNEGIKKYKIEISKIYKNSDQTKNFVIKVSDTRLIEKTGGIIQGMSGSPIVQNNKLVGAVTHVLVNDPTKGYGIFIENMLKNMPEILQ